MRIIPTPFFCLLMYCNLYSQPDTSFYFPLKTGNLWQYKEPPPPDLPYITEVRAGRDTTFANNQTYGSLVMKNYGNNDTIGAVRFERQINNKVYRYFPIQQKEFLIYDFSRSVGDTISIFANPQYAGDTTDTSVVTVMDSGIKNAFGSMRRYMTFYNKEIHGVLYWIDEITDSLGITFSQTEPGYQLYLVGAITDSVEYGTVTNVSRLEEGVPKLFKIFQNFPNPFNPSTTIYVQVPRGEAFCILIYNVLGERIRTLYIGKGNGYMQGVIWDGKNEVGVRVSSGVYFYQVRSRSCSATKKMLLTQ